MFGRYVGNFRIELLLGRGGMGEVYQAVHPEIGRRVAIKIIHARCSKATMRRFLTEARTIACLSHPSIVEIYDYGQLEDGRLYHVMELLEGRSLLEHLIARGPLLPREVTPYLEQIGSALQAAHDQRIVHRDLKPENIIVLHGEPLRLKVLDFGLVKLLHTVQDGARTATGVVIGTPAYMAPEQAAGRQALIGPRTDIYSLGLLLYLVLAGRLPFSEASPEEMATKQVMEQPAPLCDVAPWITPTVSALVHRCLEKDPSLRFASARAVVAEYAALLLVDRRGPARMPAAAPDRGVADSAPGRGR